MWRSRGLDVFALRVGGLTLPTGAFFVAHGVILLPWLHLAFFGYVERYADKGSSFRPSTLDTRMKAAAICRLFDTYVHPIQVDGEAPWSGDNARCSMHVTGHMAVASAWKLSLIVPCTILLRGIANSLPRLSCSQCLSLRRTGCIVGEQSGVGHCAQSGVLSSPRWRGSDAATTFLPRPCTADAC